jgi:hypothetical protein
MPGTDAGGPATQDLTRQRTFNAHGRNHARRGSPANKALPGCSSAASDQTMAITQGHLRHSAESPPAAPTADSEQVRPRTIPGGRSAQIGEFCALDKIIYPISLASGLALSD